MDIINKINWSVRLKNKTWVILFVASLFVLIGAVGKLFGFELDLTNVHANLVEVIYAIFGVLAVLGVVTDGTTPGFEDSDRAMSYDIPGGVDEKEE